MPKVRYMPKTAVKRMVRKTWLLYIQAEQSGILVDLDIYRAQRDIALKAVEAGDPKWKKEFVLP